MQQLEINKLSVFNITLADGTIGKVTDHGQGEYLDLVVRNSNGKLKSIGIPYGRLHDYFQTSKQILNYLSTKTSDELSEVLSFEFQEDFELKDGSIEVIDETELENFDVAFTMTLCIHEEESDLYYKFSINKEEYWQLYILLTKPEKTLSKVVMKELEHMKVKLMVINEH